MARLPDETRLGTVRLQVGDLDRSVAFYERALGLRVRSREGHHAVLGAGAAPLVELHERRGVKPAVRGTFGLYHFAILLPERAALGRALAHLGALGVPLATADHLVSEAVYLSDPDGLGIEVYADRPRAEWVYEGGELKMTTAPLDVRGVLAAAGGRAWDRAPDGTRIGHIHLHVGDLRAADAFYSAVGLQKTVWSYPGALFFAAGGYHHHVGTNTWSRGPAAGDDQARLIEWTLGVPDDNDAAAAADRLRAAGYAVEGSGSDWTTADPWGTSLRIAGGRP